MTPMDVFVPKFHAFYHLLSGQKHFGNPSFYWNFFDEELNRVLKASAKTVSQLAFEGTLLLRMRDLANKPSMKRPLR